MPEQFVEIPFELFRSFKRAGSPLYEEPAEYTRSGDEEFYVYGRRHETTQFTSISADLAEFISKHFYDPLIANPDLKEQYLTRLNIFLQYQKYIEVFERMDYSRENLVRNLMQAFERKHIFPVCKNFLRFAKG